ncbi:MAG: hypothetical protein M3511_12675 [Deinococcota bacterium]|nr:hypothetical protein [Deinococcota bacterium]
MGLARCFCVYPYLLLTSAFYRVGVISPHAPVGLRLALPAREHHPHPWDRGEASALSAQALGDKGGWF